MADDIVESYMASELHGTVYIPLEKQILRAMARQQLAMGAAFLLPHAIPALQASMECRGEGR